MATFLERFTNLWRDELMDKQQVQREISHEVYAAQQREQLEWERQEPPQRETYFGYVAPTDAELLGERIKGYVELPYDAPVVLRQFQEQHPGLSDAALLRRWDIEHPYQIQALQPTFDEVTASHLAAGRPRLVPELEPIQSTESYSEQTPTAFDEQLRNAEMKYEWGENEVEIPLEFMAKGDLLHEFYLQHAPSFGRFPHSEQHDVFSTAHSMAWDLAALDYTRFATAHPGQTANQLLETYHAEQKQHQQQQQQQQQIDMGIGL